MKTNTSRVVITGMGLMSPLGESVGEYWDGLVNGRSGIGPMTLADPEGFPCKITGEVSGFDPGQYIDKREARRMARFSQLAVAAAGIALEDSGLDMSKEDVERIGVVMGNGNGGFPTTDDQARVMVKRGGMKISPFFIPMVLPNMAAANVSRIYGIKGYTNTVVTACAAGTQGIGEGAVAMFVRGNEKCVRRRRQAAERQKTSAKLQGVGRKLLGTSCWAQAARLERHVSGRRRTEAAMRGRRVLRHG